MHNGFLHCAQWTFSTVHNGFSPLCTIDFSTVYNTFSPLCPMDIFSSNGKQWCRSHCFNAVRVRRLLTNNEYRAGGPNLINLMDPQSLPHQSRGGPQDCTKFSGLNFWLKSILLGEEAWASYIICSHAQILCGHLRLSKIIWSQKYVIVCKDHHVLPSQIGFDHVSFLR